MIYAHNDIKEELAPAWDIAPGTLNSFLKQAGLKRMCKRGFENA